MPAPDGSFAHPHRGIATFSYLLKGEVIHFDSKGGHGTVKAGGVQWMNAGNGIVHDEGMPNDLRNKGGEFHAFQFWVNLPAKNKAEAPDYMPVQAEDLPVISLDSEGSTLKVLLGKFGGKTSPIPAFSEQFIWHAKVSAGGSLSLPTVTGYEYAGYLAEGRVAINQTDIEARGFFAFGNDDSGIVIDNPTSEAIDVMIFGGEPYLDTRGLPWPVCHEHCRRGPTSLLRFSRRKVRQHRLPRSDHLIAGARRCPRLHTNHKKGLSPCLLA